ncbi:MAG: hypothetical protein JWL71_1240 [Acidobacteria bacterium]|nr:hypothetical protein [Acidobacteriota bacterium]
MTSNHRRGYVDWARGIAVLLMIEAHTADAWTRLSPAVRRTVPFRDATVLGGFAAPLFLWLAGLAVVLAATRSAERTGSRRAAAEMICRRGLEIFLLGFLFRLQGFIITPGSHPVTLFRVDILNIMGPAIAVAGVVWGLAGTAVGRVGWYAAIATAIAMATPLVRIAPAVDALPLWLQWYARPAGEFTIFTLFPWTGFVFAGGAVGALIAAAREEAAERRLHLTLGVLGAALVAVGVYTAGRPSIYTSSSFWTSSPTWFAIRVGILMIALTLIYGCEQLLERVRVSAAASIAGGPAPVARRGGDPLAKLGRSSLFIYWIHVELVYGYASWMWRHRLPLWGTAIACTLFCILMYRAIGWRDLLVERWRHRSHGAPRTAHAATA